MMMTLKRWKSDLSVLLTCGYGPRLYSLTNVVGAPRGWSVEWDQPSTTQDVVHLPREKWDWMWDN